LQNNETPKQYESLEACESEGWDAESLYEASVSSILACSKLKQHESTVDNVAASVLKRLKIKDNNLKCSLGMRKWRELESDNSCQMHQGAH
jgi:hypothetical protein